jgi:hypothetical protein
MLRALAGDSTITSLPTDFPLDFFGVALLDFAGVLLFPFLALGLVAGLASLASLGWHGQWFLPFYTWLCHKRSKPPW